MENFIIKKNVYFKIRIRLSMMTLKWKIDLFAYYNNNCTSFKSIDFYKNTFCLTA